MVVASDNMSGPMNMIILTRIVNGFDNKQI